MADEFVWSAEPVQVGPGTSRPGQPGTQLGVGPRVVPPATGLTVRRSTHQEYLRGNFLSTSPRSPGSHNQVGTWFGIIPRQAIRRSIFMTVARPSSASMESQVRAITGR